MHSPAFYWKLLRTSVSEFLENDIFTHAAALSYYTIFSLPPMLLIILYTTTRFYNEAEVESFIFGEIESLIGPTSANQLAQTIEKLAIFESTWWSTALGIAILIFTSTTVFVTMQNALNHIFKVKAKPTDGIGILKLIQDRVLSFALLLGFAFVLLVSLTINALVVALSSRLEIWLGTVSTLITLMSSAVLPFLVISFLFSLIFKWLPDVKLKWRHTVGGGIITALLFSLGKHLISIYIGNSRIAGMYDAAGSVMVIMIWVFYASVIFLFGAVLTYSYTKVLRERIEAEDFAVQVVNKEIELE